MKKLLLLPGLGDVHWALLKLQSWLQAMGPEWERPQVSIWDIDNRPRSLEFLKMIPWLQVGEYVKFPLTGRNKIIFDALYLKKGSQDAVLDFQGFDAFVGMNGNMRNGTPFKVLLQEAPINYGYPLEIPDQSFGKAQRAISPYFVLCFSGFGMFSNAWCRLITPPKVKDLVKQLREIHPSHRFLFTGLAWDDDYAKECMEPWDLSLVSKTDLTQFLSLLCCSDGYLGWCGGNSIMAQHLGVPTVEWWSRSYFPTHDRKGWETPHKTPRHLVLEVEDFGITADKVVKKIVKFLEVAHA